MLNADPFDTEAQAKIEEQIRLQNVDANYETAMDTTPEAFGSVIMLYVDITVNGHAIKAFIDRRGADDHHVPGVRATPWAGAAH